MKFSLKNTMLKTGKLSIVFLLATLIVLGAMGVLAIALELPPSGSVAFIQTSGPNTPLNIGDWYSFAGQGNRPHHFIINIPCTVVPTQVFTMELYDPEIYLDPNPDAIDEIRRYDPTLLPPNDHPLGTNIDADVVTFTLFAPNNAVIAQQFYTPTNTTNDQWDLFTVFDTNTYGCGGYTLLVQTGDDDDNAWRLRVTPDDTDGIAGTGDEITLATFESSFQHSLTGCQSFYFFVPVTPSLRLNNFDMDSNWDNLASIEYTLPDSTVVAGTASGSTVWNNGDDSNRGGDVFPSATYPYPPPPGWWQAEVCVVGTLGGLPGNQYIFEPEGRPYFFALPPIPEMEVSKDDGRTIVNPNETLTYTLLFTNTSDPNNGGSAALNVVLTDQLPTNTTYVPNSCAINTHGGTCSESGGVITFVITEPVAADSSGSTQFSVQVNPAATGTVFNSVTLDYQDGFGNQYPPETATDTDTIIPISQVVDLEINKTDGGVTTIPGGTVVYTITYANLSLTTDATGVVITETVPTNTTFNAANSDPLWACAGSTCTWPVGDLPANASNSIAFAVDVDASFTGNMITNTVTIGGNEPETNTDNNSSTDTTPVVQVGQVDLEINKSDGGVTTIPGGTVVYTITYANLSLTTDATGVVITETVPANTTYNSTAAPGWTCVPDNNAGSICSWPTISTLVADTGGSTTFAVDVDASFADPSNTITNTVTIGGNEPDPNPDNNSSTDTTPILYVDPIITKRGDPDEAGAGDSVYFSITVLNPVTQSVTAATGVLLIEPMPAELDLADYSTASDPGGLVDNVIVDSSDTITVDIGVLDVGQSATLYITATVNNSVAGPTTIANTAYLEFNEGPPRNDTASLTVPNPNTSPNPKPSGGKDDDDDDNPPQSPPPAAAQPPPAEPATLPVMFLPETGIGHAETNDWFALPLLGVMLAIYLWRITKKN